MVWPHSFSDLRDAARRRLPRFLFDYVDGGSIDELSLARNSAVVRAVTLRQRVLNDVSASDLSTTLFGQKLAMPLMLAPIGMGGLLARRGEVQALRAAHANGVPMVASTVTVCSAQEIARTGLPFWFQLYMEKDRCPARAGATSARASPVRPACADRGGAGGKSSRIPAGPGMSACMAARIRSAIWCRS